MHRVRRAFTGLPAGPLTALLAIILVLTLAACGGREEEEPAPVAETLEPTPDLPTEPAIEETPEPTDVPREKAAYPASTLPALALRPEAALLSLALPPMQGVIDRGLAFAERVMPDEAQVHAEHARWVELFAEDFGIEDAETLSDIAAGIGLDPERPIGLFLGGDRLLAAMDEIEAQAAALAELEATGEANDETDGDPMLDEDGRIGVDALELERAMDTPDFAVLLPCDDCPKTVEVFRGLAADLPDVDLEDPIDVEVGGVTILQFGGALAYFVTDEWFAAGSALELLTGIAHRFEEPAETKYGTPECPAYSDEEIVALFQADRLAGITEAGVQLSDLFGGDVEGMILRQLEDNMAEYSQSDDPVVLTLRLDEEEFEFLVRVDTAERPGLLETAGAAPLELTASLPERSLAFMGWHLTEESKQRTAERITGGAGFPMTVELRETVEHLMEIMGDELALASTGPGFFPIIPRLLVAFRVTDAQAVREMLDGMEALAGYEFTTTEYEGIEVVTLQEGQLPMLTLSYAIVDDTALLSLMAPDSSELISVIDGILDAVPSPLFSSLEPPIDPAAPYASVIVLDADYVARMLATAGSLLPQARTINQDFGGLVRTLDEVRMVSGLEDDWQYLRLRAAIKPAAADLQQQAGEGTK